MDDVCLNLGRVHQEAFLTGRTHHEDVSLISKFVDVYSYVIIALLFPNDWTPAEGQFIAKLESVLENTGCDDFFIETGSQYQSRKFNHLNGMRSNAIVINMSCYELWQEHNIPHVYSAWFMWSELFPEVVYKMTTFEHQVCTMHRSGVFPLPTDAMERLNQVILNKMAHIKPQLKLNVNDRRNTPYTLHEVAQIQSCIQNIKNITHALHADIVKGMRLVSSSSPVEKTCDVDTIHSEKASNAYKTAQTLIERAASLQYYSIVIDKMSAFWFCCQNDPDINTWTRLDVFAVCVHLQEYPKIDQELGLKIKAFLMASPPLAGTLLNPTKFRRLGRPVG